MKKLLLLVLVCFYVSHASSQVLIAILFGDKLNSDKMEFGFNISPTLSSVSGMTGDYKPGLGLGLYFNFKLNANLYFHPELNAKSPFGIQHLSPYTTGYTDVDQVYLNDDKAQVSRKLKAISMPLLMRYRIKGLLFAQLGPQLNVFHKSRDVFETSFDDNKIEYAAHINNQVSFMDVGLTGGLEYKLKKDKGLGVALRYYYGLTDVMTKIDGSQQNSAFYLSVFIPMGGTTGQSK